MISKLSVLLASGLGLGFFSVAPGTVGTILGVILTLIFPQNYYLLLAVIVLGTWVSHLAEKALGQHDSPKIVIDEVAGYLIAAFHWNGLYLLAAFVLFRFFDIIKPTPIKQLQSLPEGIGIMADDLLAGALANFTLIIGVYLIEMI